MNAKPRVRVTIRILEKDFDFLIEPATNIMHFKKDVINRLEKEMVTKPTFANQIYNRTRTDNFEPRRSSLASDLENRPNWDHMHL